MNGLGFSATVRSWSRRIGWDAARAARLVWWHGGWQGLACVLALLAAAAAWSTASATRAQSRMLAGRAALAPQPLEAPRADAAAEGRARLARFEAFLADPADIPSVLRDMIAAAEAEKLELARGDYRFNADAAGGFSRYSMVMPVVGAPDAIHRFMLKVLQTQKSMALQSVQFQREHGDDRAIEARIQWTLFTRMPGQPALAAEAKP